MDRPIKPRPMRNPSGFPSSFPVLSVAAPVGWNLPAFVSLMIHALPPQATSAVYSHIRGENRSEQARKHAQQTLQQSNQHAEAIADKLIECARSAPNTIVEAAAKNFPTAYKLDYGPRKFNEQQLDELRGRSPRSKIHDTKKTQSFVILKLNGEKRPTFYAELQEFPDGNTVKATYSQSEDSLFDESEDYVLRAMSLDELQAKLLECKKEQFNLRVQQSTGQLQNTAQLAKVRKEIAKINTLISERNEKN